MIKTPIKYIRFIFQSVEIIFFQFLSFFYSNSLKYKDLWLFCERGIDAQDNAFLFLKYIQAHQAQHNTAYVLSTDDENLVEKVRTITRLITYRSFEHKMAFTLCKKALSTHTGFIEPWNLKLYKLLNFRKFQYVFLQHGVSYNDTSKVFNRKISPVDCVIICSYKENEDFISERYGFTKEQIKLTGFARFDRLISNENKAKNEILFMPSWRREIRSYEQFIESPFFLQTQSFITNKELIQFLKEKHYTLNFVLHPEFGKYVENYRIDSDHIAIHNAKEIVVQDFIIDANLLVTDYSSVFFDTVLANKPVIFYQFSSFQNYQSSHFDFSQFGVVLKQEDDVVKKIIEMQTSGFQLDTSFKENVKKYFKYRDSKNCKRIYDAITA